VIRGTGIEARLSRLETRLHAFRAEVLRWQLDHARYHAEHETGWGLIAVMRAHPLRTLAVGLGLGTVLAAGLSETRWWTLLGNWLR
jgi:hypothetical protein